MLRYNKKLKGRSRTLRRNMTDAEKLLWSRLRRRQFEGHQFYRQKTIGDYIVDFYCPAAKLVVEVDGGQHYEARGKATDRTRDDFLSRLGLRVLRFSDREVLLRIDSVLRSIWGHADPLAAREEGP